MFDSSIKSSIHATFDFPRVVVIGGQSSKRPDRMVSKQYIFLITYIHRRKELTRRGCERCEYLYLQRFCCLELNIFLRSMFLEMPERVLGLFFRTSLVFSYTYLLI